MKRYGDLFTKIADIQNVRMAHENARHGKGHYWDVQEVNENPKMLEDLVSLLKGKAFTTAEYRTKIIHKPKRRKVYILPYYPDRIVHHAVMNVIRPIWDKAFIYDTYSAIPGRGLHKAIDRLDRFLGDERNTRYCLQFDIRKYYPSIWHDKLIELVKRKIKCRDTMWLLEDVIRSPGGERNIPIGNYLSQYFGNIYLNRFDHWLKEDCGVGYYIRYNDDGVILSHSKKRLHGLLKEIREYLWRELGLELNTKTRIYPSAEGIDYLGYRSYKRHKLLRKRSAKNFIRKMKCIREYNDRMEAGHIIGSVMSYVGWLEYGDCYNLLCKHLLEDVEAMSAMDRACQEIGMENPLLKRYEEEVCRSLM